MSMRTTIVRIGALLGVTVLAACQSSPHNIRPSTIATDADRPPAGAPSSVSEGFRPDNPSLVGVWTPSDGTSEKVFDDSGRCENAFYADGRPLDIGGPMYCHVSQKADEAGRYKLLVEQGPNRATYLIEFHGEDSVSVYDKPGELIYSMARF